MNLPRLILLGAVLLTALMPACSAAPLSDRLTEEEREFIRAHPVIRLGVDPKFIPYEFIDSDGVYKGITADYLKLISERTGLRFEVAKGLPWEEAHDLAIRKQLDALPCVGKTAYRERFFVFSNSYFLFQRVIFVNEKNTSIRSFGDLANKSVAVQVNSSHYGYLRDRWPGLTLNLYRTVEEALKAVADGEETAFIGNLATSSYLARVSGITNLKYIKMDVDESQYLYFAVRDDWPVLAGILNKALADISEAEKIRIYNRWIGIGSKADYTEVLRIGGIIGAVVVIILAVSAFWIVRLRSEVKVRRQVEAQLQVAKEEAENANHVKSSFLARMSHEIRTPLHAITGMAYVIRKTNVTAAQRKYLDRITRSAQDMLGIINDILDFSKIEAGKIGIERVSFNLDDVLQHLMSVVAFKIEEHNIDFSMERDPQLPVVFWGDPNRLQQVLLNLVNNAVKFTQDGKVAVSVRLVAKVREDYLLEFSVRDTGIGMTEEQLAQVFTPFSQADSSISRRFGGTGLGLSIVKSLVELMGGSIQAFSAAGEGSTFNVRLTLTADQSAEYEERKRAASAYFRNVRILVVEKSSFYANLLGNYLGAFNIAAEFAASEARALELLKGAAGGGAEYSLVLVDAETLPEGPIEFRAKVRGLKGLKEAPKFIVMIPIIKEELFDKLEAAGLGFVLSKPIVPSILYNEIVEALRMDVAAMGDQAPPAGREAGVKADRPYRVLIVEDNKTNQFIAQSILTEAGFRVTLTDNGMEGYETFQQDADGFDVVLMDLHMPVMNGFETTEMIRRLNAGVPVIAMTADAIIGVEDKCRGAGFYDYISKPFDPEQFVEIVLQAAKAGAKGELRDDVPALDEADGIRRLGGKADLYELVLAEYYKENAATAAALQAAIADRDYAGAGRMVHKLKGSSGSIGAKGLYEAAVDLQKALAEEDEQAVPGLYERFAGLLARVLGEIERRRPPDARQGKP